LGGFIKDYLAANISAPLGEIHAAYKDALTAAYPEQARKHRLHKIHYTSFYSFCNKLRRAGLIEEIRQEPAVLSGGELSMAVKGHDQAAGGLTDGYRIVYRLTALGATESETGLWLKPSYSV